MEKDERIFVAGHGGLVGSAIKGSSTAPAASPQCGRTFTVRTTTSISRAATSCLRRKFHEARVSGARVVDIWHLLVSHPSLKLTQTKLESTQARELSSSIATV